MPWAGPRAEPGPGLPGTHESKSPGARIPAVSTLTLVGFSLSFSQSFTMKGSTSHDDFKFKVSPTGRQTGCSPQPGPHLPMARPLPPAPTQYCLQLGCGGQDGSQLERGCGGAGV